MIADFQLFWDKASVGGLGNPVQDLLTPTDIASFILKYSGLQISCY